jgi:hypothetical protein
LNQKPGSGEEDSPSSRLTHKTKAVKKNATVKISERDVNQQLNPFDVDDQPVRISSASTDSATTVSPDTPVAVKKNNKENIAVKKDKKVAGAVKANEPAEKIKTTVPAVIVVEDTDDEDEDDDEDPEGTSASLSARVPLLTSALSS